MIRIRYAARHMHWAWQSWTRSNAKHPPGAVSPFREEYNSDGMITGYSYDIRLA